MNISNQLRKSLAQAAVAAVAYVIAMSSSAQELTIRSVPISGVPAPYTNKGFIVEGLRMTSSGDVFLIPPSLSIIGSRIVVTFLMPVDRTVPMRGSEYVFTPVMPPGVYTLEVVERGITVPERRSAPVSFTVPSAAEASAPAFSVFDRKIKKFFLTAKAADVVALVAGNNATTGPEWLPVEDNIRVWATAQPFTVPVCRFYVPVAAVHFFSADEVNDCRKLRGLAGFSDEGTAFHVIPPYREPDRSEMGGRRGKLLNACPIGTDPVYRMFDDTPGHAGHRYSTSPDVVANFVANMEATNGYRLEGVAFCSPRE